MEAVFVMVVMLILMVLGALVLRRWSRPADTADSSETKTASSACGSCDPVNPPEQIPVELSPQEKEQFKRERALEDRREALQERLIRLFSKIDYEANPSPYGRLSYQAARSAAKEILAEVGHIFATGATFSLWSEILASADAATDESLRKARIEITSLLYVGLRQEAADYLHGLLLQWGVSKEFLDNAYDEYDEYKSERVEPSDFDYAEYDD